MKKIVRYLSERIVQTGVLLLNIIVFVLYAINWGPITEHTLAGMIMINILFILRGIIWEGMLTDKIKNN